MYAIPACGLYRRFLAVATKAWERRALPFEGGADRRRNAVRSEAQVQAIRHHFEHTLVCDPAGRRTAPAQSSTPGEEAQSAPRRMHREVPRRPVCDTIEHPPVLSLCFLSSLSTARIHQRILVGFSSGRRQTPGVNRVYRASRALVPGITASRSDQRPRPGSKRTQMLGGPVVSGKALAEMWSFRTSAQPHHPGIR
jgi:hypothetical protein